MKRYSTNYEIDGHPIDEIVLVSEKEWDKYFNAVNWQGSVKSDSELWLEDTSMFINETTGNCLIVEKDVRNMNATSFIVPKFHGVRATAYRPSYSLDVDERLSDDIGGFLILDEKGKNVSTDNIFIVMVPEFKNTYGQGKDVAFRPLYNILMGKDGTVKNFAYSNTSTFRKAFGNHPVPIYD